jgi:hypothetical protein
MSLKNQLNKLILEQRIFVVDKIDIDGNNLKIDEIEKNVLYNIFETDIYIKFIEIEKDMIYDFSVTENNVDSFRLGTVYKIDDNMWIAKTDEDNINKEGITMLDAVISFLSVQGII